MKNSVLGSTLTALSLAGLSFAWQRNVPALPPPYHTPSASNAPKIVPQPSGVQLQVPQGFHAEEFATGFQKPRVMILAPGGDILVADSTPKGSVVVLAGKNREKRTLLDGLDRPYGMAFWKEYLYIARDVGEAVSV